MSKGTNTYKMAHRRRREKKTDYKLRFRLLKSGKLRFVIRKSNNNISCQLIEHDSKGDKILASVSNKDIKKLGWKGHGGSIPSAYLVGRLCASKEKGKDAILDMGLQRSTKGSRIYAAVKGAIDAGLNIPCSKDILPNDKRAKGDHIVQFALKLKKENPDKYKKDFSVYLKAGLNPEDLAKHLEEILAKIKK
ncbi:MAG: 50S ribosomal protein L18 [Candidatus Aenigmarchaeota archaeon]|nr:50S ribosomal protein L18 [Candidatus Aenigmarchaeota archaeon]